jgi:predicted permease
VSRRSVFTARLFALFSRKQLEHELEDEIRFHLDMQAEDNRRAGMNQAEAGHAAARSFGGVETMKEQYRERRGLHPIESAVQDVRYALRMMRKNPSFTIIAAISLAIGIGANTAVFSFADALLLRPLPVPRPGEVLTVGSTASVEGFDNLVASFREYVDIRDRSQSFEGLVAFTGTIVAFAAEPDTLPKLRLGVLVNADFFRAMDVEPQLGRTFRPDEDETPGRDTVVILGHDFSEQQFGANPSVLGRAVRLNGIEFTVVGVAPPDFTGMNPFSRYDLYVPLMMWPRLTSGTNQQLLEDRGLRSLEIKGRLKPGVTMSEAQAELSLIASELERAYPETNRNRTMAIRTELQARFAENPPTVRLLAMLVTLATSVLLVSCANVAGLLTSRAPVRAREVALRLALGAGRRRVIRQLITESLLIAIAGGLVGLLVGYAGVMLLRQFQIPTDLPVTASFELDRRALVVSLAMALISAVLFGLAPAIQATRADLIAVMKATDAAGFGRRRRWGRAALVVGQVAGSVVVLVIATVMYRGFRAQLADGPGYRTDHLLQMSFNPSLAGYTNTRAQQFFEQVAEQARLVPGVRSVSLASSAPTDIRGGFTIVPEGFQFAPGSESVSVMGAVVDEYYFDTVGVSIVKGRGFRPTDSADAPRVGVVNEQLARLYWPGQEPLGKRFQLNNGEGPWVEIVGVAKTTKYIFFAETPRAFAYLPYRQRPQQEMTLMAESMGDAASLVTPLRAVVRKLDANQPIYNVRTIAESYRMRMVTIVSIIVELIAAMGMMGLSLAVVGLYGLVAYAASRRTKEIGIRIAIGAARRHVLWMVLRQGLILAVAGLGVGLLAGVAARFGLVALFPGGSGDRGFDFVAFLLVAATVLVVMLVAASLPARRASRINPTEALRYE